MKSVILHISGGKDRHRAMIDKILFTLSINPYLLPKNGKDLFHLKTVGYGF